MVTRSRRRLTDTLAELAAMLGDSETDPELSELLAGAAQRKQADQAWEQHLAETRAAARDVAEEGFDAATDADEYVYAHRNSSYLPGRLRIPKTGRWMYARVQHRQTIAGRKLFDEVIYDHFRHKRDSELIDDLNRIGVSRRSQYAAYTRAAWEAKKRARKHPIEELLGADEEEVYSVPECRRQLQKHHPDKGGDPELFHLWSERLERAKK